jgi:trans-aconitate methyltransferase
LEAAVGVGAYAPVWQRLGVSQWHGLDISNDAVAFCRERYPQGVFFVQDLTAQQWSGPGRPEKDYDVVTAIDVLYHLVEDADFEKALRHLEQRVRPGGVLLVSDVFVPHDQQTAPHVKRRSLSTYRRLLGPRMSLLDREPVFAVLGDTSARPGCLADAAKNLLWKATAQTVLHTPGMLRDAVGAAAVYLIWPLDAALRSLGAPAGTNLELALFQKR